MDEHIRETDDNLTRVWRAHPLHAKHSWLFVGTVGMIEKQPNHAASLVHLIMRVPKQGVLCHRRSYNIPSTYPKTASAHRYGKIYRLAGGAAIVMSADSA
jgi:hypothetical protein